MRPSSEITRFRGSHPVAGAKDSRYVHSLSTEIIQQGLAAFVFAHYADGQNARAKIREVVYGIGGAAGISLGAAMPQNQHGSLARDTRDFTGDKFVEHKISHQANRLPRE